MNALNTYVVAVVSVITYSLPPSWELFQFLHQSKVIWGKFVQNAMDKILIRAQPCTAVVRMWKYYTSVCSRTRVAIKMKLINCY